MSRRAHPCERCRRVYTYHGVCEICSGSGAEDPPPPEDRFADVRAAARTVTTPETRAAEARAVRAEAPTLLEVVTRHEAINRITDAIASGALSDAGVVELLATAERLKGAA